MKPKMTKFPSNERLETLCQLLQNADRVALREDEIAPWSEQPEDPPLRQVSKTSRSVSSLMNRSSGRLFHTTRKVVHRPVKNVQCSNTVLEFSCPKSHIPTQQSSRHRSLHVSSLNLELNRAQQSKPSYEHRMTIQQVLAAIQHSDRLNTSRQSGNFLRVNRYTEMQQRPQPWTLLQASHNKPLKYVKLKNYSLRSRESPIKFG